MHIKSLNGVLVMRGDKHDSGGWSGFESTDHVEAIHPRHLNVKKEQVGLGSLDTAHRLSAVLGFSHNRDVRVLIEKAKYLPAGRGFVIYHEHPQRRRRVHKAGTAVRRGSRIVTVRPPPFSRTN